MEKMQSVARPTLLLLGCICIVALCVSFIDYPLSTYAHANLRSYHPDVFVFLSEIGSPLRPIGAWGLIACGLAALFGWRPGKYGQIFIACCLAALVGHEIKDYLKIAFGRTWPETWTGNNPSWIKNGVGGFHPFNGTKAYFSFPSGHTTVDTAVLAVLWHKLPRLRALFVAAIAIVMIGLLFNDYHFLADMIGGVFFGAALGTGIVAFLDAGWLWAPAGDKVRLSKPAPEPEPILEGLGASQIR